MATIDPSLGTIISRHELESKDLEQECPRNVRVEISQKLTDWMMTGHHLDIPPEKIVAIDIDFRTEEQKRVALLNTWGQREGKGATFFKLAEALHRGGRADLVDKLCGMIKSCRGKDSTTFPDKFKPAKEVISSEVQTKQSLEHLEEEFTHLNKRLRSELVEKMVPVDELLDDLTLLPIGLRREYQESIKKELLQIGTTESITQIFHLLVNPLSTFLDYKLVEYLISKYGSKQLKGDMADYVDDVNRFKHDTTVADLMECWDGIEDLSLNYTKLQVRFGEDPTECSLERLDQHRKKICSRYKLSELVMVLINLKPGSFIATWCIPTVQFGELVTSACEVERRFYDDENIVSVSVADFLIYLSSSHQDAAVQEASSEEAQNTTEEDESDSESADWLPAFEYVPPVNEKPRDSNTGDSGIGSTVGSTIGSTIGSTVGSTFSGSAFFSKLGSIFKGNVSDDKSSSGVKEQEPPTGSECNEQPDEPETEYASESSGAEDIDTHSKHHGHKHQPESRDSEHHRQEDLAETQESGEAKDTAKIKLVWRKSGKAPCSMYSWSDAVVSGNVVYLNPAQTKRIYAYDATCPTNAWSQLPDCPCRDCSLAVVDDHLTAIGGDSPITNKLFSLTGEGSDKSWTEKFPPMPTKRYWTVSLYSWPRRVLIVAGGWGEQEKLRTVEVLNIKTRQWCTAGDLLYPVERASATLCGDLVYILTWNGQLYMRSLSSLLESCNDSSNSLVRFYRKYALPLFDSASVWSMAADLPAVHAACVFHHDCLLVVGEKESCLYESNGLVRLYDPSTDSWTVVGRVPIGTESCFAAALPNNQVMVVGGKEGNSHYTYLVKILP